MIMNQWILILTILLMIKSNTLENIYNKINRNILLTESYTEYKNLDFIIRMCRLKPYSFNSKLSLERKWIDEYGNSLNIVKNKKIKIIEGDLDIQEKIISTDLYAGLSLVKLSKMSKLLYLLIGKDEDFQEEHLIIAFLGIDNYLRVRYIYNGEIGVCSPLNLGMRALKSIAENKDIKYFTELNNKNFVLFPCLAQKCWLSFWPASPKFLETINKESELFTHLLEIN